VLCRSAMDSDAVIAPGLGPTDEIAKLVLDSSYILELDGLPDILRDDQFLHADGLADASPDIPESLWDSSEDEPSLAEQLGRGDSQIGTEHSLHDILQEPLVPGMTPTTTLATTEGATIPPDPPHPPHRTSHDITTNSIDSFTDAYNGSIFDNIATMDHGTASLSQNAHTLVSTIAATAPAPGLWNTITTNTINAMMQLPTQELAPYKTSTGMYTMLPAPTLPTNLAKDISTKAPPDTKAPKPSTKAPKPSTKPPRKPRNKDYKSPMDYMRPLVLALNRLLPQGRHLLYPDGSVTKKPTEEQILSYLKNVLGHPEQHGCAPHPVWGLKDGSTWSSFLAHLLTWLLGRTITEEAVKEMVNRPPGQPYEAFGKPL
jgi:hypothetical protein